MKKGGQPKKTAPKISSANEDSVVQTRNISTTGSTRNSNMELVK